MFEEELENCFICGKASRGLYCSFECKKKDGQFVSAPVSTYQSPNLPALLHRRPASSSSGTSSPLQSPSPFAHPTHIQGGDSPLKEHFTLPPPAFPHQGSSIPVKIQHRPSPVVPHAGSFLGGQSTDTIRYGRRPAVTNNVTSPNALGPRCACGLPAGHPKGARGPSKDRSASFGVLDSPGGFTMLASLSSQGRGLTPSNLEETLPTVAETLGLGLHHPIPVGRRHGSPAVGPTAGPSSYLSRSRSDPLPPSLHSPRAQVTLPSLVANLHLSTAAAAENPPPLQPPATATPIFSKRRLSDETDSRLSSPVKEPESSIAGDLARSVSIRRGRSRDRHALNLEENAAIVPSNYGLNLHEGRSRSGSKKREQLSRTRRGSRERRRSGEHPAPRGRNGAIPAEWSRRSSSTAEESAPSQGIAPKHRSVVPPNAGVVVPPPSIPNRLRDSPRQSVIEGDSYRPYPDRAAQELSRVFGVAAS